MYFSNIYGQFKIASEQLAKFDEQTVQALAEAARKASWDENSGSLHSPPIQLRLPAGANGTAEQELTFPWPDDATRPTAFHAAQAQLLVFDIHGASQRGQQVHLRLSGHVSETDGQPLYLFKNVPRTLALRVGRDIQDELKYLKGSASVLAYRIVHSDQDVRTTELRATYFSRTKQIERVKCIQVYDHVLTRKGQHVLYQPKLRALYDVDDPKRQRHVTTLGSNAMSELILHALSAHAEDFYAEVGNNERDRATPPTTQARKLYALIRPEPAAESTPAPPKAETPKEAKKTVITTAVPSPEPLPPEVPSEIADVAGSGPTSLQPPEEPTAALQPPPAPLTEPADPWAALEEQVAVDAQVMRQARAALERWRPLLLRGAPGTGKTLLARGLAEALCGPGNYTLVTADARWTSADVIGGLRVAPGEGLRYAFSPGIVTRAAARHQDSRKKTGHPHALIIDEFNRANQDEAFGRLLTLLDPVYRQGMPLVGPEDGAPDPVLLPEDFLLLATMNDTDAARLHEIGAALSRRFASVRMGIPANERPFLMARFPEVPDASLEALYDFVGVGDRANDLEHGCLRAFIPVGTYYVQEALVMLGQTLPLDVVLAELTGPLLAGLSRDALTALHGNAGRGQLSALSTMLEDALAQTHF